MLRVSAREQGSIACVDTSSLQARLATAVRGSQDLRTERATRPSLKDSNPRRSGGRESVGPYLRGCVHTRAGGQYGPPLSAPVVRPRGARAPRFSTGRRRTDQAASVAE